MNLIPVVIIDAYYILNPKNQCQLPLSASRYEDDAIFVFDKPEIGIQPVIEFEAVIDAGIIVDMRFVKTTVA